MTAQHTPGPWKVRTSFNAADDRLLVVGAIVHGTEVDVSLPVARIYDKADGVHVINAGLIAAAPDLLKVCKRVVDWINEDRGVICEDPQDSAAPVFLHTAIARAEGDDRAE